MAPGMRARMVDITRRMLVSKSNVTKLIDKLEHTGMVERESSAADRRLVYATLTPKGVEAVKRGGDVFNVVAREYVAAHMTATQMRGLASSFSTMMAANAPGLQSDSLDGN